MYASDLDKIVCVCTIGKAREINNCTTKENFLCQNANNCLCSKLFAVVNPLH